MEIIKHYRHNKPLRDSFNRLAEATFGLNFENWYQNGFWGDAYDPYSVVLDGEVVANVSLNRTDMLVNGQRRKLCQLGTVMTAPEHRNKGFIRAITSEIEKDTADADGMYLFGNDSVLDFYPKFGFCEGKEYIYTKTVSQTTPMTAKQVIMDCPEKWAQLSRAMEASTFFAACQMIDNPGLIFFYVSQFLCACVYYLADKDAWVIAESDEGELLIHNVFASREITIDEVIGAFGCDIRQVTLGFTPKDREGWLCQEYHEEDCTIFVKGITFDDFSEQRLRIPTLSHA